MVSVIFFSIISSYLGFICLGLYNGLAGGSLNILVSGSFI